MWPIVPGKLPGCEGVDQQKCTDQLLSQPDEWEHGIEIVTQGLRTSLVAQWLRIRLPMQGTWVQALVREDPTCRGATKPVRYNY
ncbi:hypothetical protein J1605_017010 [Eschrichtius robustus]|uniref:Uncharacterized protein n=1 Tax=Eschrichtius robustus TaxID=9764 RepID=A0AB34I0E7_ESCRO|nr:hypothetical protein J1605_017010 [Eschrichtius robustus]